MPAKIYISETDVGKGVFAKRPIKKDETIMQFGGRIFKTQELPMPYNSVEDRYV